MSNIAVNTSSVPSQLLMLLNTNGIDPGAQAGYELCKQLWIYHPLGGKLVEKPVNLALSKPRKINVDAEPKDMLTQAFETEWEALGATNHIRDVMYISRCYGAGGIVYGCPTIPTDKPIDPWSLPGMELYFNQLDPLNMAGSIVTNQNPNAPDFQKPLNYTTAAGQPYHPSRASVIFNGTPIYLAFQSSAYGYTGRSVFQRVLYPMRSYIQSMVTDDMVTFKAGLLIAKIKQGGSIVNGLMHAFSGIKRSLLQQGTTGNVLSIEPDEDIMSIDLQNTHTAMTTARDNIVANIAAGSDVPAQLIKEEAFANGFGEGTEDSKSIVQFIDGVRVDMAPLFRFFDKIVKHRAWNKDFFEAVKADCPEIYEGLTYEQAFYKWDKAFKPAWESLLEQSDEEKAKAYEYKVKNLTEIMRTMLPVIDPENRAVLLQWAADNLNEMPEMFYSQLIMDYEALAEYVPPTPMAEPTEPKPK